MDHSSLMHSGYGVAETSGAAVSPPPMAMERSPPGPSSAYSAAAFSAAAAAAAATSPTALPPGVPALACGSALGRDHGIGVPGGDYYHEREYHRDSELAGSSMEEPPLRMRPPHAAPMVALPPPMAVRGLPTRSRQGDQGDQQRASHRLRDVLESVASLEARGDQLQEQNYRLRLRCLQHMRGFKDRGTLAVAFRNWVAHWEAMRMGSAVDDIRSHLLTRVSAVLVRTFGTTPKASATRCFKAWRRQVEALREENQIFDELDAHRQGRTQLISQYRDLEAEYTRELQRGDAARAQLEEASGSVEQLQQELSWVSSSLQAQTREAEESRGRAKALDEQLREMQDRTGDLRRDLRAQSERTKRLESQAALEEQEKQELHDALLRAERVADGLRSELARRETESSRSEGTLREKDAKIAALEAELQETRGLIHSSIQSLARGAGAAGNGAGGANGSVGAGSSVGTADHLDVDVRSMWQHGSQAVAPAAPPARGSAGAIAAGRQAVDEPQSPPMMLVPPVLAPTLGRRVEERRSFGAPSGNGGGFPQAPPKDMRLAADLKEDLHQLLQEKLNSAYSPGAV
eukprot:TRINITY_DN8883_c0_g1_i1.p1 TRINITY_DN8883_c0_g1~~TRINITY_DN8883_c0_g1_i1.p1  ORF type:complete len:576 (+),score=135.90 TRINITY_DN8883_c0_g1_i1:33-1760(+)